MTKISLHALLSLSVFSLKHSKMIYNIDIGTALGIKWQKILIQIGLLHVHAGLHLMQLVKIN